MVFLAHSSHLCAIALNPLIGVSVKDTLENVTTYLQRLGLTISDSLDDPSIGFVTATAVAALLYESQRLECEMAEEA